MSTIAILVNSHLVANLIGFFCPLSAMQKPFFTEVGDSNTLTYNKFNNHMHNYYYSLWAKAIRTKTSLRDNL